MPRLSIYITDDVHKLIEKEIEDNGVAGRKYQTSAAISRLIVKGSPYVIDRTVKVRKKRKGKANNAN